MTTTAGTHVQRHGPVGGLLVAILGGRESLPEAACQGLAPRFDRDALDGETEAQHVERLTAAREVCQRCPERLRCPAPVVRVRVDAPHVMPRRPPGPRRAAAATAETARTPSSTDPVPRVTTVTTMDPSAKRATASQPDSRPNGSGPNP